jgi:DnaJ-class molecular chaperone
MSGNTRNTLNSMLCPKCHGEKKIDKDGTKCTCDKCGGSGMNKAKRGGLVEK